MVFYPSVQSSLWHNENDRHQQDRIFKSMKEGRVKGGRISLQSSILQKKKLLLLRISSQVSNTIVAVGKLVQVLTF